MKEFVFVGNRFFVLEEMLNHNLKIKKIFAVKDSYLEKELIKRKISFETLTTKKQLIDYLINNTFDYLLANGCPYILPVSQITKTDPKKKLINIHPSYLPDLKGGDPQPAAILFGRDSGATCHEMDDGIDTGDIIARVRIRYSQGVDVGLLYQMSFAAEKEVFNKAFRKAFNANNKQVSKESDIYYTYKQDDALIDFKKSAIKIFQQIKAFNNRSKGAYFKINNEIIKVYDVEMVRNKYLSKMFAQQNDNEVVLNYEDKLLIKKGKIFLKLKQFDRDISFVTKGYIL